MVRSVRQQPGHTSVRAVLRRFVPFFDFTVLWPPDFDPGMRFFGRGLFKFEGLGIDIAIVLPHGQVNVAGQLALRFVGVAGRADGLPGFYRVTGRRSCFGG